MHMAHTKVLLLNINKSMSCLRTNENGLDVQLERWIRMKASRTSRDHEEMAVTRSPRGLLPYLCNVFLVVRYTMYKFSTMIEPAKLESSSIHYSCNGPTACQIKVTSPFLRRGSLII